MSQFGRLLLSFLNSVSQKFKLVIFNMHQGLVVHLFLKVCPFGGVFNKGLLFYVISEHLI